MAKFTKKPKVIEAVKWNGENFLEVQKLVGCTGCDTDYQGGLIINMHRGSMFVSKGHFVVLECAGEEPFILSEFRFKLLYSPKK